MTRETCATCRFWKQGFLTKQVGDCRRMPPPGSEPPRTAMTDWCGEHQPVAPAPSASDDYTRAGMAWAEAEAAWVTSDPDESAAPARVADEKRVAFLRLYRERHDAG